MPFILRSKNRPDFEQYEPDSISAWSEEPDVSMAPVEAWELVESLEEALAASPSFGLKAVEVVEVVEAVVDEVVEGE